MPLLINMWHSISQLYWRHWGLSLIEWKTDDKPAFVSHTPSRLWHVPTDNLATIRSPFQWEMWHVSEKWDVSLFISKLASCQRPGLSSQVAHLGCCMYRGEAVTQCWPRVQPDSCLLCSWSLLEPEPYAIGQISLYCCYCNGKVTILQFNRAEDEFIKWVAIHRNKY